MGDRFERGPATVQTSRRRIPPAVEYARHCYSHLAGQLGVPLADRMVANGFVEPDDEAIHLTSAGTAWLAGLGLDVSRRWSATPMIRMCLDWTERRPHFAGVVPTMLLRHLVAEDCFRRTPASRALQLMPAGQAWFAQLGIPT